MGSCNSGGKGSTVNNAPKTTVSGFVDKSKYAKQHNETVDFIKKQVGVDLNKYRDGDGTSAFTTSYWDKDGFKVAFDLKGMSASDRKSLMQLTTKYGGKLKVEEGGAWIGYAYLSHQGKK